MMLRRPSTLRALAALALSAVPAAVAALSAAASAAAAQARPIEALSFLVGDWEASGGGEPGRTTGRFSFEWASDGHALLRRNEALTAAGRHEDVMLVYAAPDGALRALYTDNEGHTIAYAVSVGAGRRVLFESEGEGPRFRLWYQPAADGALATGFAMAPPGSAEFRTYLEGTARRR